MSEKAFQRIHELARELGERLKALDAGKLDRPGLEAATEEARELYERLVVLRHKAREGERPKAASPSQVEAPKAATPKPEPRPEAPPASPDAMRARSASSRSASSPGPSSATSTTPGAGRRTHTWCAPWRTALSSRFINAAARRSASASVSAPGSTVTVT